MIKCEVDEAGRILGARGDKKKRKEKKMQFRARGAKSSAVPWQFLLYTLYSASSSLSLSTFICAAHRQLTYTLHCCSGGAAAIFLRDSYCVWEMQNVRHIQQCLNTHRIYLLFFFVMCDSIKIYFQNPASQTLSPAWFKSFRVYSGKFRILHY